jgi:hypothetical protein
MATLLDASQTDAGLDSRLRLILPADTDSLSCQELQGEYIERRRLKLLFESQSGDLRAQLVTLGEAVDEAAKLRDRRAQARDFAAKRYDTDFKALQACLRAGGEVGGECPRQEAFWLESEVALRNAKADLMQSEAQLAELEAQSTAIADQFRRLKEELVLINNEIEELARRMAAIGCAIPAS